MIFSSVSMIFCHFDLWEKSAEIQRFPARRSHSGGLIFVLQIANDRFLQGALYKSNTKSYFIVISTKNEEKSLTIGTDFSVVPPSPERDRFAGNDSSYNLSLSHYAHSKTGWTLPMTAPNYLCLTSQQSELIWSLSYWNLGIIWDLGFVNWFFIRLVQVNCLKFVKKESGHCIRFGLKSHNLRAWNQSEK